MKPKEVSLYHMAVELITNIRSFDKMDQVCILKGCAELVSPEVSFKIDKEIQKMNLGEKIKRKISPASANYRSIKNGPLSSGIDLEVLFSDASDDDFEDNETDNDSGRINCGLVSLQKNKIKRDKIIKLVLEDLKSVTKEDPDPVLKKLFELGHYFKLPESHVRFLYIVYHETVNDRTMLGKSIGRMSDITEILTGCSEDDAETWCSRSLKNPFVVKGLMSFNRRNVTVLSSMVLTFICQDKAPDLSEMFLQKETLDKTFPTDSFKQSDLTKRTLVNILKTNSKANILFSGLEGTGKTELAKSIAKELGVNCYFLKPFNDKGSDSLSDRRMGLFAATSLLPNLPESILIVDEADKLLATSRSGGFFSMFMENVNDDEKAWTNQFLDQSTIRIIFIINKNSLDRSTLRRFNMILEFDALTSDQTVSMVSRILDEKDLKSIDLPFLLDFIEENPGLNIGSYALAADTAASSPETEIQKEVFFQVLNSHHGVLGKSGSKRSLSKTYDENLLNLSMPIEKLTNAIGKFREGKSHLKQLPMMFYGAPGTGKTELAHQLAKKFGMTLDIYGASELLDAYVGGTEKLIARAFKKASQDPNKILFIDEADSLFKSRVSAERSWMVSQTNELLRQMENYRGIFIAATNFNTLMDEAAMRRFHIKLEFMPLTPEKLTELYKLKFTELAGDIDEGSLKDISSLTNLTPGDVHAVWSRLAYQERLTHPEIIDEIKKEATFKSNKKMISI